MLMAFFNVLCVALPVHASKRELTALTAELPSVLAAAADAGEGGPLVGFLFSPQLPWLSSQTDLSLLS